MERIRTELAFVRGVVQEAEHAASLLFPPPIFSPSQLLLFLDKWVRQKGVISGNFTVAGGEGGDDNKDGFKKTLAVSQLEAPS